jgi:hypothetical protein
VSSLHQQIVKKKGVSEMESRDLIEKTKSFPSEAMACIQWVQDLLLLLKKCGSFLQEFLQTESKEELLKSLDNIEKSVKNHSEQIFSISKTLLGDERS